MIYIVCIFSSGYGNAGFNGPICSGDRSQELCKFNRTELGVCGEDVPSYGFGGENHTCVFIKLNKVSSIFLIMRHYDLVSIKTIVYHLCN